MLTLTPIVWTVRTGGDHTGYGSTYVGRKHVLRSGGFRYQRNEPVQVYDCWNFGGVWRTYGNGSSDYQYPDLGGKGRGCRRGGVVDKRYRLHSSGGRRFPGACWPGFGSSNGDSDSDSDWPYAGPSPSLHRIVAAVFGKRRMASNSCRKQRGRNHGE